MRPDGNASDLVATDLDRTFTTPELSVSQDALDRLRQLRSRGIHCVLVTGRALAELPSRDRLLDAFDGFILEGGAVWGKPDAWRTVQGAEQVLACADRLDAGGASPHRRTASFSVERSFEAAVRREGAFSVQPNRDRVDVLPHGVDKATGLRAWLRDAEVTPRRIIAVGDGENDLPLLATAHVRIAVANAIPELRAAAHWTTRASFADGFCEAADAILANHAEVSP